LLTFRIDGGGYGLFGAVYDPSPMMNANDNGFITVEIQYRLGAFGFLSSTEVYTYGGTNAGLLDQRFAMEWVRNHIQKFGGDPTRVTIGGESSGAGSVMLHSLAYGGREDHLFTNVRAPQFAFGKRYDLINFSSLPRSSAPVHGRPQHTNTTTLSLRNTTMTSRN
jgi:carboxylesterase type B